MHGWTSFCKSSSLMVELLTMYFHLIMLDAGWGGRTISYGPLLVFLSLSIYYVMAEQALESHCHSLIVELLSMHSHCCVFALVNGPWKWLLTCPMDLFLMGQFCSLGMGPIHLGLMDRFKLMATDGRGTCGSSGLEGMVADIGRTNML